MANYYATARSNYFAVKDLEAFKAAMPEGIGIWDDGKDGLVGVYADGGDGNGWPSYDHEADTDIDLCALIAPHLKKGEIAVFMEAGNEKLRYVIGVAEAVNSDGETVFVALSQIYKLAESLQSKGDSPITQAEY